MSALCHERTTLALAPQGKPQLCRRGSRSLTLKAIVCHVRRWPNNDRDGDLDGGCMPTKSPNPETIALHAGYRSDPTTTAVAVPIYQTTSYQFHRRCLRRDRTSAGCRMASTRLFAPSSTAEPPIT